MDEIILKKVHQSFEYRLCETIFFRKGM